MAYFLLLCMVAVGAGQAVVTSIAMDVFGWKGEPKLCAIYLRVLPPLDGDTRCSLFEAQSRSTHSVLGTNMADLRTQAA